MSRDLIRHFSINAIAVIGILFSVVQSLQGQCAIPRSQHAWGKFYPGSWKLVRVVTDNLDKDGNVVSSSETQTRMTLISVTERAYTLQVENTVKVAGKRVTAVPITLRKGFNGQARGQSVSLKTLGREAVYVNGRKISSEVRQIVVNGGDTKSVTKEHFSSSVSPHVLRRETKVTSADGKVVKFTSRVDVLALSVPVRVLKRTQTASRIKTIHNRGQGKTVTIEVHTQDVPGGVIAHNSEQIDADGNLVSRSTLELIDYHVVKPAKRPIKRLINRMRRIKVYGYSR